MTTLASEHVQPNEEHNHIHTRVTVEEADVVNRNISEEGGAVSDVDGEDERLQHSSLQGAIKHDPLVALVARLLEQLDGSTGKE